MNTLWISSELCAHKAKLRFSWKVGNVRCTAPAMSDSWRVVLWRNIHENPESLVSIYVKFIHNFTSSVIVGAATFTDHVNIGNSNNRSKDTGRRGWETVNSAVEQVLLNCRKKFLNAAPSAEYTFDTSQPDKLETEICRQPGQERKYHQSNCEWLMIAVWYWR